MRPALNTFIALWLLALLTGCPSGGAKSAASQNPSSTKPDASQTQQPSAAIPADEPLCKYAGLRLGMNSLELAQVYNAPEGRGAGFTRVLTQYDAVAQHYIDFDQKDGEPARRLIAVFYRDQLYWIIDRRDKISAKQAEEWRAACIKDYGQPSAENVPGAQWSWDGKGGVKLVFTQDNASADRMSANLVLVHEPTQAAAREYLSAWAAAHPDFQYPQP